MLGILTEKPSAAQNFATALGGSKGTYNGEEYMIAASHGHLFGLVSPEAQVSSDKSALYKSWDLKNLPWILSDIRWTKEKKSGSAETLKKIDNVFSQCDEIVIATDDDPTGEGELLAWEIIDSLGYGDMPISRMYFEDETPKSIQKAFVNRKRLPKMEDDPDYRQAYFRERWDFLSIQFTRIATKSGDGYTVIRQGRLKSAMVVLVGNQLKAVKAYQKIPFFENRFRDENGVVYSDPNAERFKDKEDVPDNLSQSDIVHDKSEMKATAPGKLLDLASLSSILAAEGFPAQTVLDTYQKMYENHIVSYPRTEDKWISLEQFNEMLPLVDKIAKVVNVNPSLLTHRTPRKTHIKTGMAHGANRPGTTVPDSLSSLSEKYGSAAPRIYEVLARNFLALLAEDYTYEHQEGYVKDYPSYRGSANIPKSMGWKAVFADNDDKDKAENVKGLGTVGTPFVHEGFPPKPEYPTMKWLMKQLEKRNVGTGATRTSIFAQITTSSKNNEALIDSNKKGRLTMTEYGDISYILLPNTHIGDLSMTEHVYEEMKGVADGTLDAEECLKEVAGFVTDDITVMQENGRSIPKKSRQEREIVNCTWEGKPAAFSRTWGGYRFSDDEVADLVNGEEIGFNVKNKDGDDVAVKGILAVQEYEGKDKKKHKYLGFKYTEYTNLNPLKERVYGTFNGEQISFKRIWGGHRFSDDEVNAMLSGGTISFMLTGKDGEEYEVRGHLAKQKYNGTVFYGFEKEDTRESNPDYCTGMFKGKKVTFKRSYGTYKFSDDECRQLLNGETIELHDLQSSSGKTYSVKGKLQNYTYKKKKYFGFRGDFI